MSSNFRISRAFKNAKRICFNADSKFVLFSDSHRGDNGFADDFAHNRSMFKHALEHYYKKDFTYIELGDGDELWENRNFSKIFKANKHIYLGLKKFHDKDRLHFIWGNHDMKYKKPSAIRKNLHYYYDSVTESKKELLIGASFSEAIILEDENNGKQIFLLHGHQADWFNYVCWRFSSFLVKILWKPLQILGFSDPTSPAQNWKERIKVEHKLEKWIQENNNQMMITGHTHRPRFPDKNEIPFFNDGSCVHPRSITGIEIENNEICLIKWHIITLENGTLQIKRTILEGPESLTHYMN
ncbi:metallophosphoesterase family protein [Polaribacter ponticola]|uniref:Metallophosphoesterase family protein n=1 Tax=Polaribacter ponticola TaxID=2978475 RepID=A0ABT5SAK2_9FLAO|nr:metallophosphoesterase family protein [Polaribacter sp. MSW5]MDD7915148.1 metallophosphoesterase family protein [Polaribacter sp. MSW5]